MEQNTDYPLTPFVDFAANPRLETVEDDDLIPWGYKACGETVGDRPASGSYEGMGDDAS